MYSVFLKSCIVTVALLGHNMSASFADHLCAQGSESRPTTKVKIVLVLIGRQERKEGVWNSIELPKLCRCDMIWEIGYDLVEDSSPSAADLGCPSLQFHLRTSSVHPEFSTNLEHIEFRRKNVKLGAKGISNECYREGHTGPWPWVWRMFCLQLDQGSPLNFKKKEGKNCPRANEIDRLTTHDERVCCLLPGKQLTCRYIDYRHCSWASGSERKHKKIPPWKNAQGFRR